MGSPLGEWGPCRVLWRDDVSPAEVTERHGGFCRRRSCACTSGSRDQWRGSIVYWEVNADGEGRCYTLINDERVDRTVLRLLLDETGPPSFVRKSWLFKFIEDDRLIVDLDARPSQPDFEKLHDRCIGALQIMREPTKEQAMALMAHKERAVRNYALAQMQRWSETWSGNEPRRVRRPTRVYHQR